MLNETGIREVNTDQMFKETVKVIFETTLKKKKTGGILGTISERILRSFHRWMSRSLLNGISGGSLAD